MCNDYRLMVDVASIVEDFAELKIKIRFGEGTPNLEAREDIKITEVGPIVRTIDGTRGEAELVKRRWSWRGPNKRPVYNFRSEGREFTSNRCLIISDGFYEFTDPKDPKKKRKDKWLFRKKGEPIFCIAGIWRETRRRSDRPSQCLRWSPDRTSRLITIGRSLSWNVALGAIGLIQPYQQRL